MEEIEINEINVNNEYDNKELSDILSKQNVFIKGTLPGVGKTTAAKNVQSPIFFVSLYNKLCQELKKGGNDSVTLNKLLGVGIDESLKNMKEHETSSYKSIVFDEILYNPKQLYTIKMYMERNKDKRFYCTGDIDQRKPFNFEANNVNENEYQMFCMNQMFPDQITLKINKRLKSGEDKQRLILLKNYIFDLDKKPIETLKKME